MSPSSDTTTHAGISFLADIVHPGEAGFPEDLTPEQREFAAAMRNFLETRVIPQIEEIDHDRDKLVPGLLRELGEVGFFLAEVPEELGGLNLGIFATIGMTEHLGRSGSFGVAAMVQQGIAMQPTTTYGSDVQRQQWIPTLATAEWIGAYGLTEPSSGSDALAAKTTAVFDKQNSEWVLNGTKQFITNAMWAHVFTIFAQVEGDKFTAFIVPRETPGFEVLDEEDKMGIKGSSTCALRLTNVRIPEGNRLGEIGRGHKIALNMLNLGRLKLGATMLGADKMALRAAVAYGLERKQFDMPVVKFGLMKQKVADCAAMIFGGEAIAYRTAQLINDFAEATTSAKGPVVAKQLASEEFAVECAIAKIFLTECATLVADHTLQMLGGYGFCEEFPLARNYRDVRVSRLYEGTNEINRIVIVNSLVRKVSMDQSGPTLRSKIRERRIPADIDGGSGERGRALILAVEEVRQQLATVLDALVGHLGDAARLRNEQELSGYLADVLIQLYVADSCALRAAKIMARGDVGADMKELAWHLASLAINRAARDVRDRMEALLGAILPADKCASQVEALGRLAALHANRLQHERAVSEALIATEGEWPEFAPPAG